MHNSTLRGLTFLITITTIFALSCDSENNNIVVAEKPSDYFPLAKGEFQIYDVHQITYTLGVPAEENFALKTIVVDSILRDDDVYDYVQYRYKRVAGGEWMYAGTVSIQAGERELVSNEENSRYLKFRTPFTPGYTWNGNAYNNHGEDAYVLQDAHVSVQAGETSFQDCLVINQEDNEDFVVFLDQRTEVYARGIGLVLKELRQLHYCTRTESGCLGQQIVDEGVEYTQTLVTHGRE